MERIREDEKDKIKYILSNYDENDPAYIEARRRVEYEIECLKIEAEEQLKKEIQLARQIVEGLDSNSKNMIENWIRECKKTAGDEWLEEFETKHEKQGRAMAIAYEEVFGVV